MSTGPSGSATGYLKALFRDGTLASKSDSELLEQFIAARSEQDESAELAYSVLLARHGAVVLRVCRGVLGDDHQAEDAFQATFLVLASRARSIRRQVSLASWLYGVALRVAGTERSRAARRRRHERRHAEMIGESNESSPHDDESTRALHEEIGRLPERYRSPVVLCYIEGMTQEAAALRLGRPVGTVYSRLATARERLKARLTRRGLAPAMIPLLAPGDAISTVMPAALEESTLRASIHVVIRKSSIAGIASAEAIALMEITMKNMMIGRVVFAIGSVLAAGFCTVGAAVVAYAALAHGHDAGRGRIADPEVGTPQPSPQEERAAQGAGHAAALVVQKQAPSGEKRRDDSQPIFIQVETVDSHGKPLSSVRVGTSVSYAPPRTGLQSAMIQSATDELGRARSTRVEVPPGEHAQTADIWAYKPGRALARISLSLSAKVANPVRLTLEDPAPRTIRVVGHDGKPIEGLRVVPRKLQFGGRSVVAIPDEWLADLARITDENGAVAITAIPRNMNIVTMHVIGRDIVQHELGVPEPEAQGKYVIKLGKPGRLVGVVRDESGEPMVDVSVSVWVRASGDLPAAVGMPRGRRRATRTQAIGLDPERMRTGPQGAFRTPANLLGGMSYRVSISQDGFAPFVSEWVKLDGEHTAVGPITLRALRKLTGVVRDRQGQPVADAKVFLPSQVSATKTDATGQFELAGIEPGKTFVLVQCKEFRFQGWPVDPSKVGGAMSFTLARKTESPQQVISAQPDQLSDAELKALGGHMLESSLKMLMAREGDSGKQLALTNMAEFAPDRVREILDKGQIKEPWHVAQLRGEVALQAAAKDAVAASAQVAAIADPRARVNFLVRLARALRKTAADRRRMILEEAIVQARTLPAVPGKITTLALLIRELRHASMVEQAKLLCDEGLKIMDSAPPSRAAFARGFLAQLAALDPARALARIQKCPGQADRDDCYGDAAVALALSRPDEAERFFNLIESRIGIGTFGPTLRLCKRLGKVDLARAQKIAEAIEGRGTRAYAFVSIALGAFEQNQHAVGPLLDRSLEVIDEVIESGRGVEPVVLLDGVAALYPTNPAAEVLPIVERIAPERLAEFFWRAVALHERISSDDEDRLQRSAIGTECSLLAHYDHDAAAVLFEPMNAYIQTVVSEQNRGGEVTRAALRAKACIDPAAAVALLDQVPLGEAQSPIDGWFEARLPLAKALLAPREKRWAYLWEGTTAQSLIEDDW